MRCSPTPTPQFRAFGLASKVYDAMVSRHRTMMIDSEKSSGEKHDVVPVPSVYIVGTNEAGQI